MSICSVEHESFIVLVEPILENTVPCPDAAAKYEFTSHNSYGSVLTPGLKKESIFQTSSVKKEEFFNN